MHYSEGDSGAEKVQGQGKAENGTEGRAEGRTEGGKERRTGGTGNRTKSEGPETGKGESWGLCTDTGEKSQDELNIKQKLWNILCTFSLKGL